MLTTNEPPTVPNGIVASPPAVANISFANPLPSGTESIIGSSVPGTVNACDCKENDAMSAEVAGLMIPAKD